MSDSEIRTSYLGAADRRKQVQVLADLNAISTKKMKEKLRELGLLEEEPKRKKTGPPSKFDAAVAEKLYREGLCDQEMAKEIGCGAWKISEWRKENNLPANRKKRGDYETERLDELRAMELYNEGLCDLDIAETLGVKKWRVGDWRRMMRLPANVKEKEPKEKTIPQAPTETDHVTQGGLDEPSEALANTEKCGRTESSAPTEKEVSMEEENLPVQEEEEGEERYMSAEALLAILQRLHDAYPGEKVTIRTDGREVRDVLISVTYNAKVEISGVELTLLTE